MLDFTIPTTLKHFITSYFKIDTPTLLLLSPVFLQICIIIYGVIFFYGIIDLLETKPLTF